MFYTKYINDIWRYKHIRGKESFNVAISLYKFINVIYRNYKCISRVKRCIRTSTSRSVFNKDSLCRLKMFIL